MGRFLKHFSHPDHILIEIKPIECGRLSVQLIPQNNNEISYGKIS
jgi:hypothetical protein